MIKKEPDEWSDATHHSTFLPWDGEHQTRVEYDVNKGLSSKSSRIIDESETRSRRERVGGGRTRQRLWQARVLTVPIVPKMKPGERSGGPVSNCVMPT